MKNSTRLPQVLVLDSSGTMASANSKSRAYVLLPEDPAKENLFSVRSILVSLASTICTVTNKWVLSCAHSITGIIELDMVRMLIRMVYFYPYQRTNNKKKKKPRINQDGS
jgi:hypothetical protein